MVLPFCDCDGVANGDFNFLLPLVPMLVCKPGGLQPSVFDVFGNQFELDAKGFRDVTISYRNRGREINRTLLFVAVEVRERV